MHAHVRVAIHAHKCGVEANVKLNARLIFLSYPVPVEERYDSPPTIRNIFANYLHHPSGICVIAAIIWCSRVCTALPLVSFRSIAMKNEYFRRKMCEANGDEPVNIGRPPEQCSHRAWSTIAQSFETLVTNLALILFVSFASL